MSNPIVIKKSQDEEIEVAMWAAFLEFTVQAKEEELSSVQRIAYITNWYSSELLNGGHLQYIYNIERFKHEEVISSLEILGAKCQCDVLQKVMDLYIVVKNEIPKDYDGYISWNEKSGYEVQIFEYDQQFYQCRPEIETELLVKFLKQNEDKFIKWI